MHVRTLDPRETGVRVDPQVHRDLGGVLDRRESPRRRVRQDQREAEARPDLRGGQDPQDLRDRRVSSGLQSQLSRSQVPRVPQDCWREQERPDPRVPRDSLESWVPRGLTVRQDRRVRRAGQVQPVQPDPRDEREFEGRRDPREPRGTQDPRVSRDGRQQDQRDRLDSSQVLRGERERPDLWV